MIWRVEASYDVGRVGVSSDSPLEMPMRGLTGHSTRLWMVELMDGLSLAN